MPSELAYLARPCKDTWENQQNKKNHTGRSYYVGMKSWKGAQYSCAEDEVSAISLPGTDKHRIAPLEKKTDTLKPIM